MCVFPGIENMNPAEVELVIMCKLELSAIARQRHHAALAARIVLGAMKMLQASEIFKPKKDDPQNARYMIFLLIDVKYEIQICI